MIGKRLDEAVHDPLDRRFDIRSVSNADEAIELLLHEDFSGIAWSGGELEGEHARALQDHIESIDEVGGELLELNAELINPLSLADRLKLLETRVASGLRTLFGWEHFEVRLLDRNSQRLELVITNGIDPLPIGHTLIADEQDNGISGYVAATGNSYLCPDCVGDPRYLGGLAGARSSLTTPLRLQETVIGVLNVESDQLKHFNEESRLLLELYGRYVAMAVNILDMLIVERYTTNERISSNFLTELEVPADGIESMAEALLKDHTDESQLTDQLHRIIESVAAMRARIRSCTAGPQTILGAEKMLHQQELEPILEGRTVLVVDDEPGIRQTICAVLEQRGCTVVVCPDGGNAIDKLIESKQRAEFFDLVISDVRMPDRNGYEVFRATKDASEDTPVILMTGFGYDPNHSIVRSNQEGLHCFLFKPFQIEQLLEEVYKALVIEE